MSGEKTIILGGGMTGLAAGVAGGLPILEASDSPGGICASYYLRPGDPERFSEPPDDQEAYRFEVGGGHWIFGGESGVSAFIRSQVSTKKYLRHSAVYFREMDRYVPFPLQYNLRYLDESLVRKALAEVGTQQGSPQTMKGWLSKTFGPTLCSLFFHPFHEKYTAGLCDRIAPRDRYKTPVDRKLAERGAREQCAAVGYNRTFCYPEGDLSMLARQMAAKCTLNYGSRVEGIDLLDKEILLTGGRTLNYDRILSTIPLNRIVELTGLDSGLSPPPYTSVLVLNIGAVRGERCPHYQWLYIPDAQSAFYRVGFYSNVDPSFLPRSAREDQSCVSIYVERAYPEGRKPGKERVRRYADEVVRELQDWGFIGDVEVLDPSWVDVAYTWTWPGSDWRGRALEALEAHGIYQVGRYARWSFQGMADSIGEGLAAGKDFRSHGAPGAKPW